MMQPRNTTLKPVAGTGDQASTLAATVVIATCNRAEPLAGTLASLNGQTRLPAKVVIVDSSPDGATADLVDRLAGSLRYPVLHVVSTVRSAAVQRNQGVELSEGDYVFFIDDDVMLEPQFLAEIAAVFEQDTAGRVGGVSGLIVNQTYAPPRGLNKFLLGLCLGRFDGRFAGQLVGPAVNFLPEDRADAVQPVEWLFTTGTGYRRSVLAEFSFAETFSGYSFAEDVHLSASIGRRYRLLNTTRARFEHLDLGKDTHRDWRALGESMVVNRHHIMTTVLERQGFVDHLRLFLFEIVYFSASMLAGVRSGKQLSTWWALLGGKLSGFAKVWTGRSVHQQARKAIHA